MSDGNGVNVVFCAGKDGILFVMGPHSKDLDRSYFLQDLIDEAVLDIDAA